MTTRPSARVTLLLLATAAAAGSLECGGIAIVEPPRGDAGAACTAGLGDCDQSPSNGCETDLTSDAQHCGACGHGCQGGHCQSARCQAIVLAQGQAAAYRLAVDETHVYWTLGAKGIIARVPITGGQPETFASSQNGPADVAVQGGQVYWVNAGDGTVQRAPAAGGATTQIAAGQGQAWSIAVVAGTVIWNGPMGKFEDEPFRKGTIAVAEAMAATQAVTVVGGGETAEAVEKFGYADRMSHVSTGGGAFLESLEGKAFNSLKVIPDR